MAQDPITWATTDHDKRVRQTRTRREDGSVIVDKYPHTASPPPGHPLAGRGFVRWVKMVDGNGNIRRAVLTEASSSYDTASPYAQNQREKFRAAGWIAYGECPKATIMSGAADPFVFIPANRKGEPCQRGSYDNGEGPQSKGCCPCVEAEVAARRAAARKEAAKIEGRHRTDQAKLLEEQTKTSAATTDAIRTLAEAIAAKGGNG